MRLTQSHKVSAHLLFEGFYEKLGFKLDYEILDHKIRGEIIECFRMEMGP